MRNDLFFIVYDSLLISVKMNTLILFNSMYYTSPKTTQTTVHTQTHTQNAHIKKPAIRYIIANSRNIISYCCGTVTCLLIKCLHPKLHLFPTHVNSVNFLMNILTNLIYASIFCTHSKKIIFILSINKWPL